MMSEATDRADQGVLAGRVVANWRVVRLLGKGGMAEVYEVEDVRLGARYALKLFTYDRGADSAIKERFFTEGRLLAKLDHPRLVRVYDVGEDAETGRPYFVMDLVLNPEGKPQTLADTGAEGADEDRVAMWYEDLRSGLAYIHGKGILHRDLKLQNVLIGPDGHVILSDFGVAKIFNPDLRAELGLTAEMTLMSVKGGRRTVMGSVGYMAPEVEMGIAASIQSDWYALGVLTFHLLTGVWCDARTDIVGDLETYNPVWRDILPKLLLSNPAGRECLSWTERERIRREEAELVSEKIYLEARDKLSRAKQSKKLLSAIGIAGLGMALLLGGLLLVTTRRASLLDFDNLCAIPSSSSYDGKDDEATTSEWNLAQVDAWVLSHSMLADMARGGISKMDAAAKLRENVKRIRSDGEPDYPSAYEGYDSVGDDELLADLLEQMADKLEGK